VSRGIPSSMDADMVRDLIRSKIKRMRTTQQAYAEMSGYSAQHLSDVLGGKREPSHAVLKAEGLVRVTYYEYKSR
jgi:transcriptional regulator with XRE-family HTH domain